MKTFAIFLLSKETFTIRTCSILESFFCKLLSKENFLVCHYLKTHLQYLDYDQLWSCSSSARYVPFQYQLLTQVVPRHHCQSLWQTHCTTDNIMFKKSTQKYTHNVTISILITISRRTRVNWPTLSSSIHFWGRWVALFMNKTTFLPSNRIKAH